MTYQRKDTVHCCQVLPPSCTKWQKCGGDPDIQILGNDAWSWENILPEILVGNPIKLKVKWLFSGIILLSKTRKANHLSSTVFYSLSPMTELPLKVVLKKWTLFWKWYRSSSHALSKNQSLISLVCNCNKVRVFQLLITNSDPWKPLTWLVVQFLCSLSNMYDMPCMGHILC